VKHNKEEEDPKGIYIYLCLVTILDCAHTRIQAVLHVTK
jgi:hypothetical protein